MSTLPKNDPLNPKSVAPPEEQPAPAENDEELPSLEGMIFSPYLTLADLTGAGSDQDQPILTLPVVGWESPPLEEDAVINAAASISQAPGPAQLTIVEARESALPPMDWLPPLEEIAEKLTPLGRQAASRTYTGLYGNLADTTRITMDQPQPIPASPEATPDQPGLPEAAESKGAGVDPDVDPDPSTAASALEKIAAPPEHLSNPLFPRLPAEMAGDHNSQPALIAPDQPAADEPGAERLLFQSFTKPPRRPPSAVRIPNLGHFAILAMLTVFGLLGAGLLTRSALHFHLFGITNIQKAITDVHYTIGSMVVLYLITFAAALLVFPLVWQKGLFAGLQWNARTALRSYRPLLGAACVCFLLAMADEVLLPGPANAPIDQLFNTRAAAWLLFAFGVTVAPFFEEIVFRGFLLPALSTAFDWSVEKATGIPPRPLDPLGHPQWSLGAMIFASIATSIPFALMHAEQTAWSLGPFLLLVAVSLVLCWARFATRSLAASVLVHAFYNFLLFALMLLGTNGFRHLDKM